MRRAALFVLIGSVSAFAQSEVSEDATDADETTDTVIDLDEILNNPLSESDYREQTRCLRARTVDEVEVLDETLVLFHLRNGKLQLNQLTSRCYGLEEDMILRFRVYAGAYCRLDAFRGIPRFSTFAITADCRLGDFEPIDEVQVEALRTAIEERTKVEDMAKKTRSND